MSGDDCVQDRRDLWDAVSKQRDATSDLKVLMERVLTEMKAIRESLEDRNTLMDERCRAREDRIGRAETRIDRCEIDIRRMWKIIIFAVGASASGTAGALKLFGMIAG